MSSHILIWLDGSPTTTLPLPDRGLGFGDGLFETFLLSRGHALFTELHFDRLREGLAVLGMPDCVLEARRHLESAANAISQEGWTWAVLRMTITRGAGPRGYAPPENPSIRILVEGSQIDRDCLQMSSAANVSVAPIRLATQPMLARIKHLNRLEQVLAASFRHAEGADECVVLDQSGHVISVIAGNIFVVSQNKILTPRLVDCGVEGTWRRIIIEKWAPSIGLDVSEAKLTLTDLDNADEIFYSNSLVAVRPVATLGKNSWDHYEVCSALFQQFLEEVA